MFCQECGKPADAGIRYCPHCGANVAGQETEPAAAPQVQPGAPAGPLAGIYAGFWARLAACLIDLLIVGFIGGFVGGFTGGLVGAFTGLGGGIDDPQRPEDWLAVIGIFGLSIVVNTGCAWLYEALLTSSHWQATLGKRALRIVVTDENGGRISFARASGRHFAKWVSWMLLGIGYLMQPFTPKKQALHDMIAGTLVVKP